MQKINSVKNLEQINSKIDSIYKRKPAEERFGNPIIKVDVKSGEIMCNWLKLVWEFQAIEHISPPKN